MVFYGTDGNDIKLLLCIPTQIRDQFPPRDWGKKGSTSKHNGVTKVECGLRICMKVMRVDLRYQSINSYPNRNGILK